MKSVKAIAYDAYQELAEHYAAEIDTKPYNAYYAPCSSLAVTPHLTRSITRRKAISRASWYVSKQENPKIQ